ncbi:MAG TPA: EamA family transporter [Gemmatimonadaceae bacterium]|nr:EamA family transporter [Gemmatimonadaceae bacterium]
MLGPLKGDHPRAERARLLTAFAAVYVLWGSTFLAMRFSIRTIPPFLMASGRHLTAGVLLIAFTARRLGRRPTLAEWRDAAVVGVLLLGANGLVAWSELRVPSGTAALLVATVPLWMVLIDWLRPQGLNPGPTVLLGLAIGFAGLVTLVGPGAFVGHAAMDLSGAAALVLGSIVWAGGSITAQRQHHVPVPLLAVGMQMVCGGGALFVVATLTGETTGFSLAQVSMASWLGWGYLVVFGSLVGFTAYAYVLRHTTAARASTYAFVNPVIAVVLGWAFAGELVTARTLSATAVIVAGVVLITAARTRVSHVVVEEPTGD